MTWIIGTLDQGQDYQPKPLLACLARPISLLFPPVQLQRSYSYALLRASEKSAS